MIAPRKALPLALLVLACTPKPGDTNDDTTAASSTGDGTTAADTSGSTASPTTGDGGLSETSATATVPATTGDPDPTATDTATDTTDPNTTDPTGGPDLPTACEAMCTAMDNCFEEPEQPHDVCVSDCVNSFAGPECPAVAAAFWQCVAGLTCEELLKFIDEGPTDKCIDEFGAVDEVCSECGIIGQGDGESNCSIGRECEVTEEYVCEGETCTCTVNGEPGKSCPAEGFCMAGFDAQEKMAQTCCGWVWP